MPLHYAIIDIDTPLRHYAIIIDYYATLRHYATLLLITLIIDDTPLH
jgi:hypothetical protein